MYGWVGPGGQPVRGGTPPYSYNVYPNKDGTDKPQMAILSPQAAKSHACAGRYRCAYFRYSYFQDEYLHCAHDTLISATRTPQSGFVC